MEALLGLEHVSEQVISLVAAFVLCTLLGVERHYHQKDAGVKTHVLVGVGSCIFTMVSMYGFSSVLSAEVHLDPSRVAAGVVSGIGFLGAGVIFANNDNVRGLTTAATVWVSAAIGMACGSNMIAIAAIALGLHYMAIFLLGPLANMLPSSHANLHTVIEYDSHKGILGRIMVTATKLGYTASVMSTETIRTEEGEGMRVVIKFEGHYPQDDLVEQLRLMSGVNAVDTMERQRLD